ncbi:major facilitator superfamily protein [Escherichia coli]|nr:major facilitator superfamily protein [Escherichia coli]
MTGRCLFGFSGEKPFLLPDNEGVKMNTSPVRMDDLPLNRFHCRIAALTFGAHLTDGYVLGVIGYAIIQLTPAMQLTPFMAGMIGGSALLGLFLGSLVLGWISDHIGRQKIFTFSFLLITLASFLQFFATTPEHLIGLRILIGIGLGGDYSVGHTLLAEFSPRRHRGILLGAFSVVWTVGYVLASIAGHHFISEKPGGLALATGIGSSARVVDYVITLGNARITTLATAPGAFCRSSRYRASLFWSPCFTGR